MNVMPQLLLQHSLHGKRRNMSKRGLDSATYSNGSRIAFDTYFKPFKLPLRKARGPFEFLRMHSNALERVGEALHA
jgi:hypothetical protein